MKNQTISLYDMPPNFTHITPVELLTEIDSLLAKNREKLKQLLKRQPSWDNLIQPLEDMDEHLHYLKAIIGHLNAVKNTTEIREVYREILPKITAYHTELSHNNELFQAFLAISQQPEYQNFSLAQKKLVDYTIRDFRLSGVNLPKQEKERLAQISEKLAKLEMQFEENILDYTDQWQYYETDINKLAGIPEWAINAAKLRATEKELPGYLLNLEFPCYAAVMSYARDRELREHFYHAYVTRASEFSPKFDNTDIMQQIMELRFEYAKILGFNNYAELSLATHDAPTPNAVLDFLFELANKAKPKAEQEWQELKNYAKACDGITELAAWDSMYYSEKLQTELFHIADDILKPYFPVDTVLNGLFILCQKLFGITIQAATAPVWHEDVRFYQVYDQNKQLIAAFYFDLYARPQKRGGAWMDELANKHIFVDGRKQYPITFLTCNFSAPVNQDPALLTFEEVCTVFHEFGHGLHQMLTQVEYASVSGLHHVAFDVVEFPSQFMEHFCYCPEVLAMISKHYKTQEILPNTLQQKIIAARKFHTGLQTIRQLEFGLFDMRLHIEFNPKQSNQIQTILDEVRKSISVIPTPNYNRFQHAFSHVFAGGYAAGYYGYKWAEVLSCDAFLQFKQHGILNQQIGKKFRDIILAQAALHSMSELFRQFSGHTANINALLDVYGLS